MRVWWEEYKENDILIAYARLFLIKNILPKLSEHLILNRKRSNVKFIRKVAFAKIITNLIS